MKHLLLSTAAAVALLLPGLARADTIDPLDPLHSVVCAAGGVSCVNTDMVSFAPIPGDTNWSFEPSPGPQTGDVHFVILVPTNQINVSTFNLPDLFDNTATNLGAGSVVSRSTLFNSGDGGSLAGYAGLPTPFGSFSPTDNFSNASAGQATYNPGFSGNFLAFVIDAGTLTLDKQGATTVANDFSFGASLPIGTVITAFMASTTTSNDIGTAASEDLIVTQQSTVGAPGPIAGAGLPGALVALLCGFLVWKRKGVTLMPS